MKRIHLIAFTLFLASGFFILAHAQQEKDTRFVTYIVDPKKQDLKFYWKNEQGELYRSIQQLKQSLEKQHLTLEFAMNGGMYMEDHSPLGLYIENGKTITGLNLKSGSGNFYLQPNGVFYITRDRQAVVCESKKFKAGKKVLYATQSGPMLVVDGNIPGTFKQGSVNLNIRNGVGILPDHTILFAMSKEPVNFYDFALYFKTMGCRQALYLDGFVSRTYLPSANWVQTDGDFGVLIAVSSK